MLSYGTLDITNWPINSMTYDIKILLYIYSTIYITTGNWILKYC